ncbi:hypothetical protein ACVGXS_01605, partial [Enterobacter hormaechei]
LSLSNWLPPVVEPQSGGGGRPGMATLYQKKTAFRNLTIYKNKGVGGLSNPHKHKHKNKKHQDQKKQTQKTKKNF